MVNEACNRRIGLGVGPLPPPSPVSRTSISSYTKEARKASLNYVDRSPAAHIVMRNRPLRKDLLHGLIGLHPLIILFLGFLSYVLCVLLFALLYWAVLLSHRPCHSLQHHA